MYKLDNAVGINNDQVWNAFHGESLCQFIRVKHHRQIEAGFFYECFDLLDRFFAIDGIEDDVTRNPSPGDLLHDRQDSATGRAPRGPEIENHNIRAAVRRKFAGLSAQKAKRNLRCRTPQHLV